MTNTMKRLAVLLIGTLFVLCVAIVLAVSLPVSTAFAAEGETATDTGSEATVHDHNDGTWTAITADGGTLQSGNYYLTSDVTLTTDITIADNATVTLCLNGYKLTGTGAGSVITVDIRADFTLEDCRAESEEAECQHTYYVADSGRWVFYEGDLPAEAPENATTGTVTGGVVTGGNGSDGGGVYVTGSNSKFTLENGIISGNTASDDGGGVYVDGGTFTINGGTIAGNTAEYGGGVFVKKDGIFTLTSGAISGNTATYYDGGGVFVGGTFTMEGGTISDNTAARMGGGVYISINGTFTMNGGTISGNTVSQEDGGGVYVEGTFILNKGEIAGNYARHGGGVCVSNFATVDFAFTMNGGTISDNTADQGGGVYGYSSGTVLKIDGGTISGNTSDYGGGGVYVESSLVMTGGTISENYSNYGSGVYVVSSSTFTLSGGTISGNTAKYDGGGVEVYGTFTMEGGTISGNTAIEGGNDIYKSGDGVISISGGYFSEAPDAAFIADNHTSQDISVLGGALFDSDYIEGFPYAVYKLGEEFTASASDTVIYDGSPVEEGVDFTVTGAEGVEFVYAYSSDGGALIAGLPTDAGEYTVYAYALNGEKQLLYAKSDITVAKVAYDMSCVSFKGATVTYDGEAHSLAISGDLPAGVTVNYANNGQVNAGEYTVTASFMCDPNYTAGPDMTATLTIAKAAYDMSGITFENGSVTYDGEAHSLAISGTLPDGVTVTYEGNDKVNAGTYTVTAKFAGDYDNYEVIADMTAVLIIAKAMPVYTTPENLTICVEHTLADVTLPEGWTWEDGTLSVGEAGEKQFKAIFTPEETSNYNTVEESVTVTVTAHTGGTATCTHKAVCSVCGMEYGELAAHVFDRQVVSPEYFASEATCTHKATYYYSCVCGEKGTETFEYGELAPHVFDQKVATAEYLASEATCTHKATYYYSCVCGEKGTETFEHGELAEHTAVEIPAVEATCTQSGMTAGSKCSVCGEILVAPEEIAPLGHIDENGDELCDRCGFDMSIPEFTIKVTGGTIEGAIGSTVIVEENGSVTVVASEAPEGKEFKGWSIDGGETIISAEAAYTFTASEDTVLTAVFADKQSDVKPGGEITPENPEGLSGGAIAGIVIGSTAGAACIGAAVWFFVARRKKSSL